jgi:CubicO group peptidase (beta-lactamase class C family)
MNPRTYWPTTAWQSAPPEAMGMDSQKLSALDPLIQAQYSNLNGLMIVHKGYVVFEKYYHRSRPENAGHVASVTKSVTSALVGIALQAGYLKSLEQKVLDFFPEFTPGPAERQKREITLRHLLTMTAPYPYKDWNEPLDRLRRQPDWVRFTLEMLGQGGRIGEFKYSTSGAHLLSAILTRATGKCAREFANEHLFRPLGMRELQDNPQQTFGLEDVFGDNLSGWVHDPAGNSTGGWGLTLTLQDMARFGFLYLNGGLWEDRQIIPQSWVEESTAMTKHKYGYLWWLGEEDGVFIHMAMGDGGNMICCIPEKDLVVAIASKIIFKPRDRMPLIKQHILPAVLDS